MLDVRRLRVLREVAREGSISRAARALSFTPSAVSQQIAKLEREAGAALLVRSSRGVRLTEAGALLVDHADAILERLAAAEADLLGRDATLRVGSFPTAGAEILPEALRELARIRPDVRLSIVELDPLVGLARLPDGDLHLTLVYEYDHVPLPQDPRVETRLVLEETMQAVLPAAHPAARRPAVVIGELADERWVQSTVRSSCHEFTRRVCRAAGFEPRIVAEFDSYEALQGMVAAGVGVGLAPESALRRPHPGVAVKPVAFQPPGRRILVAWPADATAPAGRDELISILTSGSAERRLVARGLM
jgi:molybdate transport repressor ModE-like protein